MRITRLHLKKLLDSGWQSWSTGYDVKNIGRVPIFLHPPKPIPVNISLVGTSTPKLKKPIKGWCSYYAFGTNINETKILNQIEVLKKNNLTKMKTKKELLKKIRRRKKIFQPKPFPPPRAWHLAARLNFKKKRERKK